MVKPRKELDAMLVELEAQLPKMMKDTDEDAFMETFARAAEEIEDSAGRADAEHVLGRINCMLSSHGLIPGDNEGEPCT